MKFSLFLLPSSSRKDEHRLQRNCFIGYKKERIESEEGGGDEDKMKLGKGRV